MAGTAVDYFRFCVLSPCKGEQLPGPGRWVFCTGPAHSSARKYLLGWWASQSTFCTCQPSWMRRVVSGLASSTVSSALSLNGGSSSLWLRAGVGAQFAPCPCVADNSGQLWGPVCSQHPGFTYSKVFVENQSGEF